MTNFIIIGVILVSSLVGFSILMKIFSDMEQASGRNLKATLGFLQEGMVDQGSLDVREKDLSEELENFANLLGPLIPAPTEKKLSLLNKAGIRTPNAYLLKSLEQLGFATFVFAAVFIIGILIKKVIIFSILAIAFGGLAYILYWEDIKEQVKKRALLLDKSIPDMIDLFANACAAGATFDIAADFILNQMPDEKHSLPIKTDFLAWQADIRFGVPREEAWQGLIQRSDSKNMKYFCNLMDQSEKTGGSVSESLLKMAGFFRERRKQQIEAEIAQLKGKMLSLTVAFIVVPILVLIVLPMGKKVVEAFANLWG